MSQPVIDPASVIPSASNRPPINFNPHIRKAHSAPNPDVKAWSATEASETLRRQQRAGVVAVANVPPDVAADTEQVTHSHHDPFNPGPVNTQPYAEPSSTGAVNAPYLFNPSTAPRPSVQPEAPSLVEVQRLLHLPPAGTQVVTSQQPPRAPVAPQPPPVAALTPKLAAVQSFLDSRAKVMLELADGTFYMPVVAARESEHAVFLFLANDDSTLSFIPKLGTELNVTFKVNGEQRTRAVYYPGTQIPVDELGQIIIAFIKKDG